MLNEQEKIFLQSYVDSGNWYEGWVYLSRLGDRYADNAAAITGNTSRVNIQSLDIAHQDVNRNLGNGNRIAREGSYTTTDGKTQKMGDLQLSGNPLYSRHSDAVALAEAQAQALNLQGMGLLRDLNEAVC